MLNEPTSFNVSTSARYARKYGSKTNNSIPNSHTVGSHTSRILNKSKKSLDLMTTSLDKTCNDPPTTVSNFPDAEKSSRNYRIKIKRPKSAFFTSSSSTAISKPGNSPSPQPILRQHHTDQSIQSSTAYTNTASSINPYAYLKNSYKKNNRHYFYTKEEMADYHDQVALNQLFMSKTCLSFTNGNGSNVNGEKVSSPPNTCKKSTFHVKSTKTNRYSSAKTNFLFAKPR